jgi:tetratricopeptide (TPR) repeat protein
MSVTEIPPASIAQAPPQRPGSSLDARLSGLSLRNQRHLRDAREAIERRRAGEADRHLAQALPGAGGHPEYLRLLGVTRHLQKRRAEAVEALRAALERLPADPLILCNLGVALRASGESAGAIVCLQRACELAPDLAAAWYNLGRVLARSGRPDEAAAACEQALRCDPRHAGAHIALGDVLRSHGDVDRAAAQYRQALDLPESARAWTRLVKLKVGLDAGETARLEQRYFDIDLDHEDRVAAGFALVDALEQDDRHEEAFTILGTVNALQRRTMKWDAAVFRRGNEAVADAFTSPPKTAAAAEAGREAIFVVGAPMAGSAQVCDILASHPEVESVGELSAIADVLGEESQRRGAEFPAWVPAAKPADWRRLGASYLERTAPRHGRRPRFVDKTLANWRVVGAIQAMLPAARIVHCRRDPLETCLANYRHLFPRGHAYSYDLHELVDYWHDCDGLMRYWNARYPHRLHDVGQEDLLAEPAAQIRRLLDFCRLPFDAACLRYHQSADGVRAINSTRARVALSVEEPRTAHYGELLGPLRLLLENRAIITVAHP